MQNEVTFTENGQTFTQQDSYDPETREATIAVPAHGEYQAAKFILQGRSSNSPVAGKMIVSSEDSCSLEDIPDFINPEDMMSDDNRRNIDTRQKEEIKQSK